MTAISAVIPTRDRRAVLEACLEALLAAGARELLERIVVVDDGSVDDTPAFLAARRRDPLFETLCTPGAGPATARNRGLARVRTPFVLLLGDDVLLEPDALRRFSEHVGRHDLNNASVFGNVQPDPEAASPFDWWNQRGGSQFTHDRVRDPFDAGPDYFYTTNIVSPTPLLRAEPFDESFPHARYEDRELGYRLHRRHGHRIHYRADIRSRHRHRTGFLEWLDKLPRFTWSALHFAELYPDDAELRLRLGITRAEKLRHFDTAALLEATALLAGHGPGYPHGAEVFGGVFRDEIVGASFRTLQCFFRTCELRRHLGLPPLSDPATGRDADDVAEEIRAALPPAL